MSGWGWGPGTAPPTSQGFWLTRKLAETPGSEQAGGSRCRSAAWESKSQCLNLARCFPTALGRSALLSLSFFISRTGTELTSGGGKVTGTMVKYVCVVDPA